MRSSSQYPLGTQSLWSHVVEQPMVKACLPRVLARTCLHHSHLSRRCGRAQEWFFTLISSQRRLQWRLEPVFWLQWSCCVLSGDPRKILTLLPVRHAGCCPLPLSSEDIVSFFLCGFVLRTMIWTVMSFIHDFHL